MARSLQRSFKHSYELYKQQDKCCVCGTTNCEESIDHTKVTIDRLNKLLKQKLANQNQILEIKKQVRQIYQEIKIKILNELENDQYELQTLINRFSLPSDLSKMIDPKLVSEFMQQNIGQLPSRKIIRLVKRLENTFEASSSQELQELKQKSSKIFQSLNTGSILPSLKAHLPLHFFRQEPPQLKLKPKLSISQITNPEQTDLDLENKVYEWRNIKVTKNSRTVSLSNKNISDREVMEQIPILSNYKNLRQFQIRNNKISCLTCSIIANNMPFLLSVDIRGNNITDKGIIKLIQGIPNLKSLFISETLATDLAGLEVVSKLNDLEMFWSEHTRICNNVALKIAQKPKLRVLSLIGNPIDDEYKQKMKKLFISKGYIAI